MQYKMKIKTGFLCCLAACICMRMPADPIYAAEISRAESAGFGDETELAGDSFFVTGYSVTISGKKKAVSSFQKDDCVDITVTLKNTSLTAAQFRLDDYDFSKLVDSFSDGKPKVSKDSSGQDPLVLKVKLSGLKYGGTGQSLRLQISKKGKNGYGQTAEITVTEAVVYDAAAQGGVGETSSDPMILIAGGQPGAPLGAGQETEVEVRFQNLSDQAISSAIAAFTPSEGLMLSGQAASMAVGDIAAGQTVAVRVKVKAFDVIPSPSQALEVELKFNYNNGVSAAQGSAGGKVLVLAKATGEQTESENMDAPVPNLIIRDYTYGEGSVSAGSKFRLNFTFENTGKLNVENIVVTLDGGENLTVDGSTNTYFYESLAAGNSQTLEVPFQALASAKSGAQSIDVAFRYEYVDQKRRAAANAEIKISVPVSQPDRFQINAPLVPEMVTAGEEMVLSLDYVNKGQGEIANVEAVIEGDGIVSPSPNQYLGNAAPGSSGTIGFVLTVNEPGETDVLLKVSYEDADQQLKTKEFPVRLKAEEGVAEDEELWEDELDTEEKKGFPWGICLIVLFAVVIAVIAVRRKLKGKKNGSSFFGEWEIDDEDKEG